MNQEGPPGATRRVYLSSHEPRRRPDGRDGTEQIRDGIIAAIFGDGAAAMLMYATGDISWPVVGVMASFSFWAAYRAGKAAIEWLLRLDDGPM